MRDVAFGIRAKRRATIFTKILVNFFWVSQELFSGFRDYIGRPTHDRLVALRQTGRIPREGKEKGAGRPGPPPFLFPSPVNLSHKRPGGACGRFPQDHSARPSLPRWACKPPAFRR